jgi:hypothetical protein
MSEEHDHPHDHARTFQADHREPTSEAALVGLALRELLLEGNHYSAQDEQRVIGKMQDASPESGALLTARAWLDADFKARLLSNGAETIKELGFNLLPVEFTVLENTDNVHNVVVCTLCSCYPRALLGMSPAWYKSKNYRARVVREPRAVLAEFGVALDDDIEVRVHDSTAELRYMILPQRPAGTEDWSEAKLVNIVTRNALIGTQRDLII